MALPAQREPDRVPEPSPPKGARRVPWWTWALAVVLVLVVIAQMIAAKWLAPIFATRLTP